MDIVRDITLAALFFFIAAALTSGRGLADTGEHAKSLAAEASRAPAGQGSPVDAATAKRLFSEDARKLAEQQRVREAQAKRDTAMRLCRIKPVMTDGEIEACRVAYRDLGEASK